MTDYNNDIEKAVTMELQKKLIDILIIKKHVQTINQQKDLGDFSPCSVYRRDFLKF